MGFFLPVRSANAEKRPFLSDAISYNNPFVILSNSSMRNNPIWNQLAAHAEQDRLKDLSTLWQQPDRHQSLVFESDNLYLDLSKNWIDEHGL